MLLFSWSCWRLDGVKIIDKTRFKQLDSLKTLKLVFLPKFLQNLKIKNLIDDQNKLMLISSFFEVWYIKDFIQKKKFKKIKNSSVTVHRARPRPFLRADALGAETLVAFVRDRAHFGPRWRPFQNIFKRYFDPFCYFSSIFHSVKFSSFRIYNLCVPNSIRIDWSCPNLVWTLNIPTRFIVWTYRSFEFLPR